MAREKRQEDVVETAEQTEQAEESYGWEYHKVALLIAVSLTAIFYLLIWIFIE
ncbi:hypothetical protein J7M28_11225 [bacterium]|nr:hypothetical protein [bacterium]